MKRANHLIQKIFERDNFRFAFYRAARSKQRRPDIREFASNLETNLELLANQVSSNSLSLGKSNTFVIYDPKRRTITAPVFRERVLHHAIMNVCEPYFERFLTYDTYACRIGKGRIACLRRAVKFSNQKYALKLDMKSYFNSINHQILKDRLRRKFKDHEVLQLFDKIIDCHSASHGRGLPIGSLTSQHFANFYLGWFDHFVKGTLGVKNYLRYMDDCVLWSSSRAELKRLGDRARDFLNRNLDLTAKPSPITRVTSGLDFLGCRVYPNRLQLNRRSKRRYRKRMSTLFKELRMRGIGEADFANQAQSLTAFTLAGGVKSWNFRCKLLKSLSVNGHGLEPGEPWRQLEQHPAELPVSEP